MTPDALAALHAKCFTTPRPWSASEFASFEGSAFLLSTPQGFLLGRLIVDEAELLTLAVDPAARRQGVARVLVEGFKARATEDGATLAFLEVAADNEAAIALYRSTGFADAGRRRAYYRRPNGSTLDALVMRCELGDR
ncbi:ribosomal-protein-alanine N-acetyltransferase [Litoreibacter halocynthiae]|uniref:Ribosomal-protein-alanine N-acetyltransferase n=1 Tax=Litoreibacter halocynthiae TaxID=1242689 RepID=A0A4R7LMF3_9RHOB|nr:GNAT family N-acetyltransferase [Litoreibacter halocynthiae]TDT76824.1 ribosomal-protein-alanine N-acetyltransferase [Litoreibacter halocynthiae]